MVRRKSTSTALQYVHRRFFAGQSERLAELEEARASAEVARKVYELLSALSLPACIGRLCLCRTCRGI